MGSKEIMVSPESTPTKQAYDKNKNIQVMTILSIFHALCMQGYTTLRIIFLFVFLLIQVEDLAVIHGKSSDHSQCPPS